MKNDEFYKLVLELAREEHYESALIIGAFPGNGSTEAFITGAKQNEQNPKVYCLNIANYKGHILKKIAKPENFINWHELSTSKNENTQQIVDNVMNDILKSTPLDSFDVVLIVNQSVNDELSDNSILLTQLSMANLILLDGVNNPNINNIKNILLQDSGYMLESVNSILRNGYAILRKRQ